MNTTEPNELSLDNIQEEVARILTEPKSIMLKERLQREWDAVPTFNLPLDAPAEAVAEKALELGDYAANIFDIEPPPLAGVQFIMAEVAEKKVEVVLSDMAPNTSGFTAVDQPRMIYLCELAMDFAEQVLPEGGTLVIKVFQGEGSDALRKNMQQRFSKVRSIKPAASRARSKEMYWIATK